MFHDSLSSISSGAFLVARHDTTTFRLPFQSMRNFSSFLSNGSQPSSIASMIALRIRLGVTEPYSCIIAEAMVGFSLPQKRLRAFSLVFGDSTEREIYRRDA